jgi:signal transduction histidine kinase
MLGDIVQLFRERAEAAGASLEARSEAGIGCVFLDAHAVFNSLANLVANALDALSPGRSGRVEVAVSRAGDRLVFTVSDNGAGMSPEVRAKVFRAMFSTKGSKGTGLGLLSVQKAVREHGGTIEVTSEEGAGTVFRMALPLVTEPEAGAGTGNAPGHQGSTDPVVSGAASP